MPTVTPCRACGEPLAASGDFCPHCGAPAALRASPASFEGGSTFTPACPSCGASGLVRLSSGSYRCPPEDKVFSAREVGAPVGEDPPNGAPQASEGIPDGHFGRGGLDGSAAFACPSCGGDSLERLASGSYRCLDEDKVFGAAEVEDPVGSGWKPPPPVTKTPVLVATTLIIPGYDVVRYHGEVFGFVVRSRNYVSNLGARSKAIVGSELRGLTKLVRDSRMLALERLRDDARRLGANAIVGLRFDTSEFRDYATELVAYGTAIEVRARAVPNADPDPEADIGAG